VGALTMQVPLPYTVAPVEGSAEAGAVQKRAAAGLASYKRPGGSSPSQSCRGYQRQGRPAWRHRTRANFGRSDAFVRDRT
jgi:hypothetical protein